MLNSGTLPAVSQDRNSKAVKQGQKETMERKT